MPAEVDADWDTPYQVIAYANTVAAEVLNSTGGTDADKQQLLAEALVHRAAAYLALVNCYAKGYTSATAATDLGVPLLLTPSVNADLTRAPVQAVYAQIVSDLQAAVPNLPTTTPYNTQPGQAAAYALLARTYLLLGDYGQARQNADRALALKSTLLDLNAYVSAAYPRRINDPEVILSKVANTQLASISSTTTALRLSPALLSLLGHRRPALRAVYAARQRHIGGLHGAVFWQGATHQRSPQPGAVGARDAAHPGRVPGPPGRWDRGPGHAQHACACAASGQPITWLLPSLAPARPCSWCWDERRRELFCRGFRWFDQKRLNQDAALAQTQSRAWRATTSVVPAGTYTLAPSADRYLFPIPPLPRRLNPEIAPNP